MCLLRLLSYCSTTGNHCFQKFEIRQAVGFKVPTVLRLTVSQTPLRLPPPGHTRSGKPSTILSTYTTSAALMMILPSDCSNTLQSGIPSSNSTTSHRPKRHLRRSAGCITISTHRTTRCILLGHGTQTGTVRFARFLARRFGSSEKPEHIA